MDELPSPGVKNAVSFFNSLSKQESINNNKKIKIDNNDKKCNNIGNHQTYNNTVRNVQNNSFNRTAIEKSNKNCAEIKETNAVLLNNKRSPFVKELNDKLSDKINRNKLNSNNGGYYIRAKVTNNVNNNNTSAYSVSESKPTVHARREYALTPTINVNFQNGSNVHSLIRKR